MFSLKASFVIAVMVLALMPASRVGATNNGNDSEQNNPEYWGSNCVVFDGLQGYNTWNATHETVVKVIVKGGPTRAVYESGPFFNLTAPINPNTGQPYSISHVIECYRETEDFEEEIDYCEHQDAPLREDEMCEDQQEVCETCGAEEEENETPRTPSTPATPQVLGQTTPTPVTQPAVVQKPAVVATLAATGFNTFFALVSGATVSLLAAASFRFKREN